MQHTAEMVQRIFPVLSDYPVDRIEFLVPASSTSSEWAKIMDESWGGFVDNPPERLLVQVADGPGDAQRREWGPCSARPEAQWCRKKEGDAYCLLRLQLNVRAGGDCGVHDLPYGR